MIKIEVKQKNYLVLINNYFDVDRIFRVIYRSYLTHRIILISTVLYQL